MSEGQPPSDITPPSPSPGTRSRKKLIMIVGAVVVLGAGGTIAAFLAGGDGATAPPKRRAQKAGRVAFGADFKAVTLAKAPPPEQDVNAQATEIVALFDDWYQRAFVDVGSFRDGKFPEVERRFADQARARFRANLEVLTIGTLRNQVRAVRPTSANLRFTIFFDKNHDPRMASVQVYFRATAALKRAGSPPLGIAQRAKVHLRRTPDGWVVSFFEATQSQRSILPPKPSSPSPTGARS